MKKLFILISVHRKLIIHFFFVLIINQKLPIIEVIVDPPFWLATGRDILLRLPLRHIPN